MKRVIYSMAAAAVFTLLVALGVLYKVDNMASDSFYEHRQSTSGEIVIIGIDQKALEEIGPIQEWNRDIMAMLIDTLNVSEEIHPAVIGIDVLYAGETAPDYDNYLADAAGRYSNVVVASVAEFGTSLTTTEEGKTVLDQSAILAFDEPYDALREVTKQGHINVMLDNDGILRHQMWTLTLPTELSDRGEILSFSGVVANEYRKANGLEEVATPRLNKAGFWYTPYTGLPGDYSESISVADVLWGEVPAEYFAGKIVLVGPYTAGLQDQYFTAIDHAESMYGIEVQANVIEALLRGESKMEVADWIQLLMLFAILSVSGVFLWKRKVLPATLYAVGVIAVLLLAYHIGYQYGVIFHVLWIPLGIAIFYIVSIAVNYVQSLMEKRAVTNTFKKYVAPQIVNEILKQENLEEITVGGRVVDIAVLFVDIRGFTTMSESLEPNEVVDILNKYLTLIANCILDAGGTLDKFIGDAAMAFWGAPLAQEDYLLHALEAAEAMKKGSDALSEELLERFGRTVSFGIGVHVGKALVGNIGSPDRMDYTAIGDTVNTSSRLESIAPAKTIYISKEVVDRMGDRIKATELPEPIKLKGKAEPFVIYQLDEIVG